MTFLFFKINDTSNETQLNRSDASKFMYLSFIIWAVGFLFQIIFHIGIKENNSLTDEKSELKNSQFSKRVKLNWLGYLKSYRFYLVIRYYDLKI